MAASVVLFVSKRLQRASFAFMCLALAQLVIALCASTPEPAAAIAHVQVEAVSPQ